MLAIILTLMAHAYLQGSFHEAAGLGLLSVVGGHLWMSLRKTMGILQRTFSWFSAACRLVEVILAINLLLMTVTGISMAHGLFALPVSPIRPSLTRPLHRVLAHATILLVGIHTGLRFQGFLAFVGFRRKSGKELHKKNIFVYLACFSAAGYGLVAAIRRDYFNFDLTSNLMMFENTEESFVFFLLDLVAIFVFAVIVGVLLRVFLRRISNRLYEQKDVLL